MKVKINLKNIPIYLIFLFFLPPQCLNFIEVEGITEIFAICRYLVTLFTFVKVIFSKKMKNENMNLFFILSMITIILMILAIYKNGTIYLTAALSYITILGFLIINTHYYYKNEKNLFFVYRNMMFIYMFIHFVTIILFPEGLNSNYVGDGRVYFMGGKNSVTPYMLLGIIVALKLYELTEKKQNKLLFMLFFFLNIFVIINQSSTATITLLIIELYILFQYIVNGMGKRAKTFLLTIVSLVGIVVLVVFFVAVILGGNGDGIWSVLTSLIGKDATFSGRKNIWQAAIIYIIENPIWGMGDDVIYDVWGNNRIVNSAHNSFLDFGVKYGCIVLTSYIFIIILVIKNIYQNRKNDMNGFTIIFIITLLVAMMFEALAGLYVTWIILLLIYISSKQKKAE